MENPVLEIIISGVGWWTPEDTVRKAVSTWGVVKEMKEGKLNVPGLPSFSHVKTDKWFVKLVKKKGVEIPGVVLHLGSERSGEEREMWKIWYRCLYFAPIAVEYTHLIYTSAQTQTQGCP